MNGVEHNANGNEDGGSEKVAVQQSTLSAKAAGSAESAFKEPESSSSGVEVEDITAVVDKDDAASEEITSKVPEGDSTSEINSSQEQDTTAPEDTTSTEEQTTLPTETPTEVEKSTVPTGEDQSAIVLDKTPVQENDTSIAETTHDIEAEEITTSDSEGVTGEVIDIAQPEVLPHDEDSSQETGTQSEESMAQDEAMTMQAEEEDEDGVMNSNADEQNEELTLEVIASGSEDPINSEIEELLTLLGLSQSMIQVTNEMVTPPEGHWEAPEGYRAIINPGGVGQPRDGDPRAAFMIYDTESGFEFYRVPYEFEKTQEKIIKAGLPQYLAVRLAYGR
jgi:hypothetical protein